MSIRDGVAALVAIAVGVAMIAKGRASSAQVSISPTLDGGLMLVNAYGASVMVSSATCPESPPNWVCASGYRQVCAHDGGWECEWVGYVDHCETLAEVFADGGPRRRYWRHADGGIEAEQETRRVCPASEILDGFYIGSGDSIDIPVGGGR